MAIKDEIMEQTKKMKDMTGRERWNYFWEYYKVHVIIIVCVLFLVVSLAKDILTGRQAGFYFALINADTETLSAENTDTWAAHLEEASGMDTRKYEVQFDTNLTLSSGLNSQYDYASMSKLMALAGSQTLDIMIANTAAFEFYAQSDYFYDLEEYLPADTLERVRPYLYYTDAATFPLESDNLTIEEQEAADTAKKEKVIDHHDPSAMQQPVAVGIYLDGSDKLTDSGIYAYLSDAGLYQGYPQAGIYGITMSCSHPDIALQATEYFFLSDESA